MFFVLPVFRAQAFLSCRNTIWVNKFSCYCSSHLVSLQSLLRQRKKKRTHFVIILSAYSIGLQVNDPFNCFQFYASARWRDAVFLLFRRALTQWNMLKRKKKSQMTITLHIEHTVRFNNVTGCVRAAMSVAKHFSIPTTTLIRKRHLLRLSALWKHSYISVA